jgi:hypothetical protein
MTGDQHRACEIQTEPKDEEVGEAEAHPLFTFSARRAPGARRGLVAAMGGVDVDRKADLTLAPRRQ